MSEKPTLNARGHEVGDPDPVEIPAGFRRPETLAEQVKRLIRTSLSEHAAASGMETFEEAEDFDVEDDFDPTTPYEVFFDPVLGKEISPDEFERKAEYYRMRYAKAHEQYFNQVDQDGILADNLFRRAVKRDRAAKDAASEKEVQKDAPSSPPGRGAEGG